MTRLTSRWVLAGVGLWGPWVLACESWRESSPMLLLALVAVVGTSLAVAWRLVMPESSLWGALWLPVALTAVDLVLDAASPYPARFSHLGFELTRAGALVLGWALGGRITSISWRRASRVACGSSLVVAGIVPAAMTWLALDGSRDRTEPAAAALVLGFALDDAGRAQPELVGRMEHAVDLQQRGVVARLVLSGGAARAGHTEASVMRDLALEAGVPAEALVLDEAARSTIENFACSRPILERLGAGRVLVVTEPWHMTRAMLLARRHGLDARPSPAESAIWKSPRHAVYWLFRDAVAYVRERARDPFASPGQCAAAECEGCRRF